MAQSRLSTGAKPWLGRRSPRRYRGRTTRSVLRKPPAWRNGRSVSRRFRQRSIHGGAKRCRKRNVRRSGGGATSLWQQFRPPRRPNGLRSGTELPPETSKTPTTKMGHFNRGKNGDILKER